MNKFLGVTCTFTGCDVSVLRNFAHRFSVLYSHSIDVVLICYNYLEHNIRTITRVLMPFGKHVEEI